MTGATAWRDGPPLHLALAMAASIFLHLTLLVALQPAPLPQEERFSRQAIDVTLQRALAPTAAPAPPAMAQGGQTRPPGSIDLVHTALAPGPADSALPLQRPLPQAPEALPSPSAWQPAEAALGKAAMPLEQQRVATARKPAAETPTAAAHSPDALDRVQAPPRPQPQRQAAHRPSPQNSPAPSATKATGAPARQSDTASHASRHDAREDYVLLVVRKLSQARFSTEGGHDHSARGAVIARLTVDRDGNLVGLSLARPSGSPSIDHGILERIGRAAPFAPLPKDFADNRFSFIVPINYAQER